MSKRYIYLSIFAICSAMVCYFSTNDLIITLIVFVLFEACLILMDFLLYLKYVRQTKRVHECYQFVNSFIISMSVRNSLTDAFASASINVVGELKDEITHIENMNVMEKIEQLEHYFDFDVYRIFIQILTTYLNDGGDILKLSSLLIAELTRTENFLISYETRIKSKIFEFVSLWALTYVILLFVRLALRQYFEQISQSASYSYSVLFFFIFVLVSTYLFYKSITNISFKGDKNE